MKVLDLNAVVSEFDATMRRTLGTNVHFATILATSLHNVRADAGLLQQILLNFATHARQHLSPGGRVIIETKNVTLDGSGSFPAPPGGYVTLTVNGTGPNVAAMENRGTSVMLSTLTDARPSTEFDMKPILAFAAIAFIPLLAHAQPLRDLVSKKIDAETDSLLALYKHIHAHPELAFQEEQTAARLAKELKSLGFEITTKVGGTGVVGVLKNGVGPTIMVRADMDALPIIEDTGLPYLSKVRTRDQDGLDVGVMHACGHDMNVASLVGTARVLASIKDRWHGTLILIGQPAEEIGAGAKAMLEDGLLKRFPRPDFALALHCDGRYPAGHVNYREGQMQANVDSVDILVKGKGGHGAAPHATIDPIVVAARIVLDLQTIVSRERNPLDPVVVTVGAIHGGTKHNIIPDEVKLQLTVRTLTDKSRADVLESITRISKAASYAAKAPEPVVKLRNESFTPSLYNEKELTTRMSSLFQTTLGKEKVHERPMSMGGEDFSQFTRAGLRTFYWHIGTAGPAAYAASLKGGKALASTHSPFYAPVPEPTLRTGVLTMSLAVLDLLNEKK